MTNLLGQSKSWGCIMASANRPPLISHPPTFGYPSDSFFIIRDFILAVASQRAKNIASRERQRHNHHYALPAIADRVRLCDTGVVIEL